MEVTVTFPLPRGEKEERKFYFACSIPLTRIKRLDPEEVKNCPAKTIDQLFLHAQKRPYRNFEGVTIQNFFDTLSVACTTSASHLGITVYTRVRAKTIINKTIYPFLAKKRKKHLTKQLTIKRHLSRTINALRA